jgi:hypothetical protein
MLPRQGSWPFFLASSSPPEPADFFLAFSRDCLLPYFFFLADFFFAFFFAMAISFMS